MFEAFFPVSVTIPYGKHSILYVMMEFLNQRIFKYSVQSEDIYHVNSSLLWIPQAETLPYKQWN